MHDDEVDIDIDVVRALVTSQFPEWSELPLREFASTGTVHAIYRLGEGLCIRLPRTARFAADLASELEWLPRLAPHVGLAIPEPIAAGAPGSGYGLPWAVYRWIDGSTFQPDRVRDEAQVARTLAEFVRELRAIDSAHCVRSTRDRPLSERDAEVRTAAAQLDGILDVDAAAVTSAWKRACRAPEWNGQGVWIHGDLLPSNVLVAGGQLHAVIDFGCVGVGDPAVDVIPAWSLFHADARTAFGDALAVDDGTWERARGMALHQALTIITYYWRRNPGFASDAVGTLERVLTDGDR